MKFSEFYPCNHNSCEIWHSFSRTSMRNFLWCYYRWLITSLALEKWKKECDILKFILVEGFCPLKIKITQVPDGFRLKSLIAWDGCEKSRDLNGRSDYKKLQPLKTYLSYWRVVSIQSLKITELLFSDLMKITLNLKVCELNLAFFLRSFE